MDKSNYISALNVWKRYRSDVLKVNDDIGFPVSLDDVLGFLALCKTDDNAVTYKAAIS